MKLFQKESWISVFIFFAIVLCVLGSLLTADKVYDPTLNGENHTLEILEVEKIDEGSEYYYFQAEPVNEKYNTLLFYTNHQEVEVYSNDVLIYSLENADSIFGRTPGAMWNMITLPHDAHNMVVKLSQAYPGQPKQIPKFEQGNTIQMYHNILTGAAGDLLLTCTIIVIGFALILYWLLVFAKVDTQREVLYLGWFSFIFGIWNLGETQFAVFMFDNRAFFSYLAFTCLMTMCIPAIYFVRAFLEVEDTIVYKVIVAYTVSECLIAQALHLTGIAGVKETANYTMISLGLILIYLLYAIIKGLLSKKNVKKIIVNIIGLFVLAITAVIDIGSYYSNVRDSQKIAKVGFLFYAILLGFETTRVARARLQEEQKMELLKEMAVKDLLTGCFNRNAFTEDCSEIENLTGVQVVGFDLNDLKKCNDTKGHKAGDKYIQDAAEIIQKLYGQWGKVYRVGGDEFCIVTKSISEKQFQKTKSLLQLEVARYQLENPDSGFGIACGYATYDPELDKDFEAIRHRADIAMYENKKEIKK